MKSATTTPTLLADEPPAVEQAIAPRATVTPMDGLAAVIERLAARPEVDVAKLEKIIELQERILRHEAEAEFNAAFAMMQPELPTIVERARTDKTSYAPLEDIIEPIRPVLSKHGFSISHRTEWPEPTRVKVVGILTHRGGHSRNSEFLSAADQTGSKNAIQALGSAVSYGKRYTTKDLLCIVTREEDDDGETGEPPKKTELKAPEGYDAWLGTLEGIAQNGMAEFSPAWNKSKEEYRRYLAATAPKLLLKIKTTASKAGQPQPKATQP